MAVCADRPSYGRKNHRKWHRTLTLLLALALYELRSVVTGIELITSCCVTCVTMQGFDEYMNLVLEDAEEVSMKKGSRKQLGMSCSI